MKLEQEFKSKSASEPTYPDHPLKVALSAAWDVKPLQCEACGAFKIQTGFLASLL